MTVELKPRPLRHWSHSTIKAILDDCAYRWYLERLVGYPSPTHPRATSGSGYHAGIEAHERARHLWFYSGGRAGDPDGIPLGAMMAAAEVEIDERLAEETPAWTDTLTCKDDLLAEVDVALRAWWSAVVPDGQPGAGGSLRDRVMGWRPVAIETPFRMWLRVKTKLPIVGAGDGMYLDEQGRLVGVDQKSAGNFKKYPHDGAGLRDQAAMYHHAATVAPNLPGVVSRMDRFEYHVARVETGSRSNFEQVRIVEVLPDGLDVVYVEGRVELADERVAAGDFAKNPSWFLCSPKWCPQHHEAGGVCVPDEPS